MKMVSDGLGCKENTTIIPWSAMTKQGREEIYRLLDTYLEEGCEDGK